MSGFVALVHGPLGRRQVDDRAPRRGASSRSAASSSSVLDGDVVRTHLSKGLGFSKEDRDTNIERIGWVASRLARAGAAVVVSAISPYEEARRRRARSSRSTRRSSRSTSRRRSRSASARDPKGLYAKAHAGEIAEFTGVSDPYEEPANPELRLDTEGRTPAESAASRARAARGARAHRRAEVAA